MANHEVESTGRRMPREASLTSLSPPGGVATNGKAARGPERASASAPAPVPVAYIAGIGRSGSTLLGRALGSVDGLLFLGEVMHLFGRGMLRNERCACGARLRACDLWGGVLHDIESNGLCPDPHAVEAFRHRITEGRSLLAPFLPWTPPGLRDGLASFRALLGEVYQALQRRTGARLIIDSSKSPAYGRILQGVPGIRFHLVHLVRDARGVAFSLAKARKRPGTSRDSETLDQRSAPVASALWSGAHLLTETLRTRASGYVLVRYADFVRAPGEVVREVLGSVGLEDGRERVDGAGGASPLAHLNGSTLQLGVQHVLAGHPTRSATGTVELSEDLEWRHRLAPPKRLLVGAMTFPLLKRYGCLRNGTGSEHDPGA